MWFLYVNGHYICQSKSPMILTEVVKAMLLCVGINRIELVPEKEF